MINKSKEKEGVELAITRRKGYRIIPMTNEIKGMIKKLFTGFS